MGFVAQEVEQIVKENNYIFTGVEKPQNENSHYSIRYAEFVVPLVKGMQEQQELIKALQEENAALEQRLETVEALVAGAVEEASGSIRTKSTESHDEGFVLYQNVPNPFDATTTISALVPEGVKNVRIVIYNLQGLELKSYDLSERGSVSINISVGHFPSGMYIYGLIADGQMIGTKKMILTK